MTYLYFKEKGRNVTVITGLERLRVIGNDKNQPTRVESARRTKGESGNG
jgi:hypothetical protein